MASRDSQESEESADQSAHVRNYSEFIVFLSNQGIFQACPLTELGRRQGLYEILGGDRLGDLSLERRLRPINMQMSPGGPVQPVYLVTIVRAGKSPRDCVMRIDFILPFPHLFQR